MRKNITRDGILSTQVLNRWKEDQGPEWLQEVQEETKPSRINRRQEHKEKKHKEKNRFED